ncbi:MAG: hypothetical protein ABIN94_09565 [Ferruginibacter sp.]
MNTLSKGRIRIYFSVRQNVELAKKIYEKHLADGVDSPLYNLEGFSWDATGPKIKFCIEKHKEAILLNKRAEEICRQRDAVLAEIIDIINVSKSMLQVKHNFCKEKIREWGFPLYDNAGGPDKSPP